MKFCNRPYEHLHVTYGGKTFSCSWASKKTIGNLSEQTVSEVINGPDAAALRESIEDQSFRYCEEKHCPFLSNNLLPELSEADFQKEVDKRKSQPPTSFNIAYDYTCNHACPSCRSDLFKTDPGYRKLMLKLENELLPYMDKAKYIEACGNGDLFSSKYMMNLLSKVKPDNENCLIELETNGVLVKRNWKNVQHLEDYELMVIVTPNSFEKETYKKLSGGFDNLDQTIESLDFLAELRKNNRIKHFLVTMVIQEENFREVPSFIETCLNRFGVDRVQLRPMLPWFQLKHDLNFYLKDITNPKHPCNKEFLEIMSHPICSDPKVFHWSGK